MKNLSTNKFVLENKIHQKIEDRISLESKKIIKTIDKTKNNEFLKKILKKFNN